MVRVGRHLPCNPPEVVKALGETVFKMLDNIIANPEEPKFRDLRATNKTLHSKVLSAHGGKELLHLLGFEKIFKFGENYYFMSEVSLDYLQQAKGWLQQVSFCLPHFEIYLCNTYICVYFKYITVSSSNAQVSLQALDCNVHFLVQRNVSFTNIAR